MTRKPAWYLGLAMLVAGCPADVVDPPVRQVTVAGGDHQVGIAESALPIPLEVRVTEGREIPVGGVPVEWVLTVNGTVAPESPTTDIHGKARARFTVGSVPGTASTVAVVAGRDSIRFAFEVRPKPDGGDEPVLPFDSFLDLSFTTYEGSGETVHPDFAITPWSPPNQLAITPYPNGNAFFEQPSLFSSHHPLPWTLAPGVPNPVVPAPPIGHLSDPDIVWVPERQELWLYYRQAAAANIVWLVRSSDGITWSQPEMVISAPNHTLISPSVVYHGPGNWLMWSIDGGAVGCSAATAALELRRSTDGIHWSAPSRLGLAHDGLTPWHVDVQWIPSRSEYWAVYNAKRPGSCTTPALFVATSPDGVLWTPIRQPLVTKGDHPGFTDIVYRASFQYRPQTDDLLLWVSGARFDLTARRYVWSTSLLRRHGTGMLAQVPKRGFPGRLDEPPPAELIDWP